MTVCGDEQGLPGELDAIFRLMEMTGGGRGRKAKWLFRRHFESAALPLVRRGQLRIYRLDIQTQHAAGMIAFPIRGGEILWSGAFHPEMRHWSPGIVTFAMIIRDAIGRGDRTIDLLRGQDDYKYRLGAMDHPLHRLTLHRSPLAL
jgi:CelD/BcsL family acetyltransferase involved in cellulose biosynthesis